MLGKKYIMAKGDVKKMRKNASGQPDWLNDWTKGVDGWRNGVDGWRKGVDGKFKKFSVWMRDVDDWRGGIDNWTKSVDDQFKKFDYWRRGIDKWRTTVSIDIACIKESIYSIKEDMGDMYTKQEHYELMNKIDSILGEVQESRRERQVQGYRFSTMNDQVSDHEKRIGVLEKKA